MSRVMVILLKHSALYRSRLGERRFDNSQYFACLSSFDPYMHAICGLCMIKELNVHLFTIYIIPGDNISLHKKVDLWTHQKSYKLDVLVTNKRETPILLPTTFMSWVSFR